MLALGSVLEADHWAMSGVSLSHYNGNALSVTLNVGVDNITNVPTTVCYGTALVENGAYWPGEL